MRYKNGTKIELIYHIIKHYELNKKNKGTHNECLINHLYYLVIDGNHHLFSHTELRKDIT